MSTATLESAQAAQGEALEPDAPGPRCCLSIHALLAALGRETWADRDIPGIREHFEAVDAYGYDLSDQDADRLAGSGFADERGDADIDAFLDLMGGTLKGYLRIRDLWAGRREDGSCFPSTLDFAAAVSAQAAHPASRHARPSLSRAARSSYA